MDYINKNEFDDYDINLVDNYNIDDIEDEDVEIGYTKLIKSTDEYFNFIINNKEESIEVWDIWVELEPLEDLGEDYLNNFDISQIKIYIGDKCIGQTEMLYNIVIAKYFNKEYYYEDNKIYIPIIIPDMFMKKIPLYLLNKPTISIKLYHFFENHYGRIRYNYVKKNSKDKNKSRFPIFCSSNRISFYTNQFHYKFTKPLLFIILELEIEYGNDKDKYIDIDKITLELDNHTIVYNNDLGEIIKKEFMEKYYYILPICPEIKTLDKFSYYCSLKDRDVSKLHCINFKNIKSQYITISDNNTNKYYVVNIYNISIKYGQIINGELYI